jgi:CHAT domain-containing protein
MPHITWCLTGLLTSFPIHAAGLYDARDQPKIFDYVVSSYTPTLDALLSAKRLAAQGDIVPRVLAVSHPLAPGRKQLPGVAHEVNAIQTILGSAGCVPITSLNDGEATVDAVLRSMKECNWIHIACHSAQDAVVTTDSAFQLADGRLTLKEIMKQDFSHIELAVLSACQTAGGYEVLPEGVVHLAAGMVLTGCGNVVAAVGSIADRDGPIVAEKFYAYLMTEASGDSARAAYALHKAVAHLRYIRGERDFGSWVPFIHMGICSPPSSI